MWYNSIYNKSLAEPAAFWKQQAMQLQWFKAPETIVSAKENGLTSWMADGELNVCYQAVDYHVDNGRAEQPALIYDSPVTHTKATITYQQLQEKVAKLAGALQQLGIEKGDSVVIYMPMIPEAVYSMLACARIGAIHSVVFGGFAPHELAIRIDDIQPKAILTASCGIEFDKVLPYKPLVDHAIDESKHKPAHVIVFQRKEHTAILDRKTDKDWEQLAEQAAPAACVPVKATHPLYVLYTSGTTGKPKGIVRDSGGYATALKFSMKNVYNADPGDVFWAASDVGWVVGHSYIVYGPLLHGCTTVLYEGKPIRTPDAGAFWRVISEHQVKVMFTAPTAIRAIKKEDPDGALLQPYNLSKLETIFLAGERCDPATLHWVENLLNRPVIDHWWQTESGWPMLGIMMGTEVMATKAGSAGKPVCGFDVQIVHDDGSPCAAAEEGLVAVKLPLPPGTLTTLWNNDEGFVQSYLQQIPGYYLTGDGGYKDEDGYFYIMGRVDDVINVAGHRLSTGEMEEMVAAHPAVAECAVIGIADDLRGQRPVALVVLKDGQNIHEADLEDELIHIIREQIGAVAYFRNAAVVKRLPKTRSGKILRKTLRLLADGMPFKIPSTIDDPLVLEEIREKLQERQIGNAFIELI